MHEHFLYTLAKCFIPKTEVIIITDAGFQGHGFRLIRSRGWIFVCRVLGAQYHSINGEWEKVKDINSKASLTPSYLGDKVFWDEIKMRGMNVIFIFIKANRRGKNLS
ncbi:transposase, IS10 group, partial [Serratia symbiotica str. Tucson]